MREVSYTPLYNLLHNFFDTFFERNDRGLLANQKDIFCADWNAPYNQFKFIFDAFEKNFRVDINFILQRIIEERKGLSKDTRNFPKLALDVKTFYIFLRIQMDMIAYLTKFFYEEDIKHAGLKRSSFTKQRNWWINGGGRDIDTSYSKLLGQKTSWYDQLISSQINSDGDRDSIVHSLRWIYIKIEDIDKSAKIMKQRGHLQEGETKEVLIEIAHYLRGFYIFCRAYEIYFLKKTKDEYEFKRSNYWYDPTNIRYLLSLVNSESLLKPIDYSFME